jgi:uncharacterized protein (UPF0262 family)
LLLKLYKLTCHLAMVFSTTPLTKKQRVLELINHFNYLNLNLKVENWELVFKKLVENNVFEHDQSGRGRYCLLISVTETSLLKALKEAKELVSVKLFEPMRE